MSDKKNLEAPVDAPPVIRMPKEIGTGTFYTLREHPRPWWKNLLTRTTYDMTPVCGIGHLGAQLGFGINYQRYSQLGVQLSERLGIPAYVHANDRGDAETRKQLFRDACRVMGYLLIE